MTELKLTRNELTVFAVSLAHNPFGLRAWAEDNAEHVWKTVPEEADTLWYVVTHWEYDTENTIDRAHFRRVVLHYWDTLTELDQSYFFFDLANYRHYVEPVVQGDVNLYNAIRWCQYDRGCRRLLIPVNLFAHRAFEIDPALSHLWMLARMKELVDFAEQLQDKRLDFYCTRD